MPPIALYEPHILAQIYKLLLDDHLALPALPQNAHLVLSSVCRIWRHTLLSTPGHWNIFKFQPGALSNPVERLRIVNSMAQRSVPGSLSFSFYLGTDDHHRHGFSNVQLEDLLFGAGQINILNDIILPNASRLMHLRCLLNGQECSQFLFNVHHGAFPFLEDLDIILLNSSGVTGSNLWIPDCYGLKPEESLPRLRRVHYRILHGIPIHLSNLRLPAMQLTMLYLETVILPRNLFVMVMGSCSDSLIDGFLDVQFSVVSTLGSPQGSTPIDMTSLKRLRLRLADLSSHPDSMLLLSFPVLEDLCIEEIDRINPFHWDLLFYRRLLLRSASTLQKVRLADIPLSFQHAAFLHRTSPPGPTCRLDLESLFRTFYGVIDLCIPTSVSLPQTTLHEIARGSLLPKLEIFGVGTMDPIGVLDMVRKRNEFSSASTSLFPSPITSLALALPMMNSDDVNEIDEAVKSLPLECKCKLWSIVPCYRCGRCCCFVN